MPTYETAPKEVTERIFAIISEHYPDLQEIADRKKNGLTFDVLIATTEDEEKGALYDRGHAVAAFIKRTGLKDRVKGCGDVEIVLDGRNWEKLDDPEKDALLDHELYHLEPKRDKEGGFKFDDAGRPTFNMRIHDVEVGWFAAVARRRGVSSPEIQQARHIYDEFGQAFFPFLTGATIAEVPAPKGRKKKAA